MKHIFSILIFTFILHITLFSQTGTIRIAKPKPLPKKDTLIIPKRTFGILAHISGNYTFRANNKIGYEAGIALITRCSASIGLSYCVEEQYYQLSSYNMAEQKPETPFFYSQNHSEYLKLPLEIGSNGLIIGGIKSSITRNIYFGLGLCPEYLLKTKDEHERLKYGDFNQFNLAGSITLGITVKKNCRIGFTYSKDFFENMKDRKLYDVYGSATSKQKTKTKLLSFSVYYHFGL